MEVNLNILGFLGDYPLHFCYNDHIYMQFSLLNSSNIKMVSQYCSYGSAFCDYFHVCWFVYCCCFILIDLKIGKNRQKVAVNLQQNGENSRKQPKNHKKQLKFAKKWPKYHLNHQNYSPIRATDQNQSWIPENMPKNRQNG